MKHFYISIIFILLASASFAQSDNCSSATTLTVAATCSSPVSGTTAGATQTIPGCSGTADDDVWYKFVASGTADVITVNGSASFDAVVELFSGACSSLVSVYCMDNGANGQTETIYATGLTGGSTYYIRVYHYGAGSGSATFNICVSSPPPAPANNSCFSPTSLTVNTSCSYTTGTTFGATQSYVGCTGTADDDVWYTFVATNSAQTITVDPSSTMDAVVELFSGTCGSFTSLYCEDLGLSNGNETISALGLIPGQTYYVRVYDYYGANGGFPFQICVTGPATSVPSNDNPCTAIALPAVTSDCNYLQFTTVGATASTGTAPTPTSCVGGSAPQQGGFSASSHDVWFTVVVPANGKLDITPEPNMGAGSITDGVMVLYTGTCGSLTQVQCSDDNVSFPGTANDLLPHISASGLAPGSTVYIRFFGFGSSSGTFGLCVSSPTNDNCANALYICDLNGYSASTSAAYTRDYPCNMLGNNENPITKNDTTDGINTGGVFGQGGSWGTGSAAYNVSIQNNSWIKFTASATSATFSVSVGDCWVGNFPSGGIQMQVFSGTGCCNFVPVSSFKEGSSGFSVTAVGLTVGQNYYLMVDGYASDICNYTITALSGVSFSAITAAPSTLCYGDSTTLTGPPGATSYAWSPGGQTTQVIHVAPGTTMTYTLIASGVCGYKQTLTKTITVNPKPTVLINGSVNSTVNMCSLSSTTLTASGSNTYTWNTGSTSNPYTVSPVSNTTYSVTGTDGNGCKNTATVTVNVLALPNVTVSSASPTICAGATTTLTANPSGLSYSWNTGATTQSISVSPPSNTVYTVTGTDANTCKKAATFTVTVNSLPTISVNNATICNGQVATLTATGGNSYNWNTGPTTNTVSVNPSVSTTYTVVGTAVNTCTNSATASVTVNQLPPVTVNNAVICNGQSTSLNASGAVSYGWSNSQSGPSITVNPTSTTSYTVTGTDANTCTNSAVATVTVNSLPVLVSTPSVTPSNCGGSTGAVTNVTVTGSGAITYTWTNSSNVVVGNSANISNIPAGTYSLTVTDQGTGCTNSWIYSITNPGAPPAPTVTANDTIVCVGDLVTLTASTVSSATLTWTGPGFTSNNSVVTFNPAQANQSGTYYVTATLAGCTGPVKAITLLVNPLPNTVATNQSNTYCSGSTINLFGSGGTGYSWSGPNVFSSTSQNPSIPNSVSANAGVYTLTVTDANGCVNSDTTTVNINQTPAVTASGNSSPICAGQTIQLNAIATGSPTYQWSGPNSFSSALQNPTITNASTLYNGTYTVIASQNGCNSVPVTVSVTVNPTPVAGAGGSPLIICSGNTLSLTGTGGGTYSWNGPGAYSSSAQNPTIPNIQMGQTGVYTLTVSNGFGCQDTASVSVTVNETPILSAVSANASSFCEGQTIQFNASTSSGGSPTYQWTGPNNYLSNLQNPTITNSTPVNSGTYTVTATLGACTSAIDTVNVTVNPNPIANAGSNLTTLCSGNTLNLFGATGTSYSWSGPAGFSSATQNPVISNIQTGQAGIYTLTVSNAFGCQDTASVDITVNQTPIITGVSANANNFCEGQTIQFNASTSTGGSPVFQWQGPNGYSSNQQNPSIPNSTTLNSGTYTVSATLGTCTSSTLDTVSVVVNPNPVATATSNLSTLCSGNTLNLFGGTGTSYSWSGPSGFSSMLQNPVITNSQTSSSGTYTLTTFNQYNCNDTATVSVTVNQTPAAATANDVTVCKGEQVVLNASGTGVINWYADNALTQLVQSDSSTYTPAGLSPNSPTTFYVTVTSNGCTSAVIPVTAYNYNVSAAISATPQSGYAPLDVAFGAVVAGPVNGLAYNWTFGDNASSSILNPQHQFTGTGTYTVVFVVTDSISACAAMDTILIKIEDEVLVIIPNIFTPNDDHINDEFFVTLKGVKAAEGVIYNRWGQVLYSFDAMNSSWDGKAPNGNHVTDGTYFYIIRITSFKGETIDYKGPVTVTR